MRLLSDRTRRTIKDSFQTFLLAFAAFCFAIALTFVEDLAVHTKRPAWVIVGIEALSVMLFIADGLVIFCVVARIVATALRDFVDSLRRD